MFYFSCFNVLSSWNFEGGDPFEVPNYLLLSQLTYREKSYQKERADPELDLNLNIIGQKIMMSGQKNLEIDLSVSIVNCT